MPLRARDVIGALTLTVILIALVALLVVAGLPS